MNRFQLLFGVLLLISINTNASIIKNVTFAYWNKPDVEIFYLLPQSINKDTEIVFVIHGNSRNAIDYLSAWIPYVDNKNVIIAAPQFEICAKNADKPPLTFYEIKRTLDQFTENDSWVMTSAGRFSEKAEMFPNSVFIIGADTLVRVFDEKFYSSKKDMISHIERFNDHQFFYK